MTIKDQNNIYIGLMSGTSMDAVDAVAVIFGEHGNLDCKIIATLSYPIPTDLKQTLIDLNHSGENELHLSQSLNQQMGSVFADAANALIKENTLDKQQIVAIGSHGQTIRHNVASSPFYTTQIGDPNQIAYQTGITTVADFRSKDMAAGGQGAPLAPAFHLELFAKNTSTAKVALNIGGISNITYIESNRVVCGFDTGPGNLLMDAWINLKKNQSFDTNGEWAAGGKANEELLALCLRDEYFKKEIPKSSGRELFNLEWFKAILKKSKITETEQNIQATLCLLTARSIADAIHNWGPKKADIIVCGGGAQNNYLLSLLSTELNKKEEGSYQVLDSDEYGVHPDWIEGCAFAWLAKQRLENKTGNIPAVTGADKAVILGGVYSAN